MAVDITVYPLQSPRVIEIDYPQTEVTIQDLHDAVRDWEDSEYGQSFDYMIETAGGEELGGGVTVGLTSKLIDAQIYFPPRSTPIDSGDTCTTADTDGRVLISTGSTFVTDGVVRGNVVFNSTTGAMATILSVDSETQLTSLPLTGGARNDWQVGDVITTYDNPQCSISGGNLVAVDSNGADISPVLNSPLTQVVRTASSSATLQELQDIQFSSFNGGISYDETSPYDGTTYPTGTPRQPVNNPTDAYAIAAERGFRTGFIINDMTAPTAFALSGFTFIGSGKDRSVITLPDAADISSCTFVDAKVTGYLDGDCTLRECLVEDLYYVRGYIEQCVLSAGTIELAGTDEAHFLDCWSGVPGTETPIVDCGGSGQALAMRNYNGGVRLTNKTGPEKVSIDLNSGQVRLDLTTVTNGQIVVRGVGKCVNHATDETVHSGTYGNLVIVNEAISLQEIGDQVWDADVSTHQTGGTMGEYLSKKLLSVKKFIGLK